MVGAPGTAGEGGAKKELREDMEDRRLKDEWMEAERGSTSGENGEGSAAAEAVIVEEESESGVSGI